MAFTKLSCRAPDWFDDQLLPIFCGGLKTDIRHDIIAMEPPSLTAAQRLTRHYEAKLADIRFFRLTRPSAWQHTPRTGPNLVPTTIQSTTATLHSTFPTQLTNYNNYPRPQSRGPFWQLSPLEQRERRAKGLCFHCDEQYSNTHVCKKPVMTILECPTSPDCIPDTSETPYHRRNPFRTLLQTTHSAQSPIPKLGR